MFIKDVIFQIEFSSFSERHYCKDFFKKYKSQKWVETRKTIVETLERAYLVQQTSLIDVLKYSQIHGIGIFKYDFKVAGTDFSPKTSGNRVIFSLCNTSGLIKVLLVYGKEHVGQRTNETDWIMGHVKMNFPELKKFC